MFTKHGTGWLSFPRQGMSILTWDPKVICDNCGSLIKPDSNHEGC